MSAVAGATAVATPLWGMWEMWCDLTQRNTGGKGLHAPSTPQAAPSSPSNGTQQQTTWLDSVRSLGIFDTIEGFWGIHDCIVPPSGLPMGSNFFLFRHNIPPMWEHEANRRGGKWVLQVPSQQGADADKMWLDLCVAAIGEQFPGAEEELCGVVASKRKGIIKIAVWTRTATEKDRQLAIGIFIRVLLSIKSEGVLKYVEHCAALGATGTSPLSNISPVAPAALSSPAQPLYTL